MKKLIPIAALFCTVSWNALALSPEAMLPQDSRIKLLQYDETDVYTITTRPGYQTNIVFGRSEEIQAISVGDRSFWQIVPSGNRLFIRPMNEDVSTNMTVLTNRHSYQFDLKSVGKDTEDGNNIYVAQFTYPDRKPAPPAMPFQQTVPPAAPAPAPVALQSPEPMPAPTPATEPTPSYLSAAPGSVKPPYTPPPCFPPECIPPGAKNFNPKEAPPPYVPTVTGPGITQPVGNNFNYTFAGPDDLAPLQVYDDGKSTFISYRQTSEPLPNIYLIGHDGVEHPTTYYIKGGAMVVDNVAPQMALKSSSGTVYIYNEMLSAQ